MGKNKAAQEQPLFALLATTNEVIALGAAVTTYQRHAARFPAKGKEQRKTVELLECFQRRLVQQIDNGPPHPLELELQKFLVKRKL
jgi:hypothetical protein